MLKEGFYKYKGDPKDVLFKIIEVRLNEEDELTKYKWRGKGERSWRYRSLDYFYEVDIPRDYTRIFTMPDKSDIED